MITYTCVDTGFIGSIDTHIPTSDNDLAYIMEEEAKRLYNLYIDEVIEEYNVQLSYKDFLRDCFFGDYGVSISTGSNRDSLVHMNNDFKNIMVFKADSRKNGFDKLFCHLSYSNK